MLDDLIIKGNDIINLSGLSYFESASSRVIIEDNSALITSNELSIKVDSGLLGYLGV